MNLSFFIAKRVATATKNSFSGKIILIAVMAIMISMAVMIIATGLVSGFKNGISNKIFGFWGHIHISHFQSESSVESFPVDIHQGFYDPESRQEGETLLQDVGKMTYVKEWSGLSKLLGTTIETETSTHSGIRHIQVFANKAGIIRTKEQLEGIILKGVSNDFDWTFFKDYLVEGEILDFDSKEMSREILVSETTSRRLKVKVGDRFKVHFVEGGEQIIRTFKIRGIYKTGLEEYDKKFALVDIRQIQRLNGWEPNQISGFEVFVEDIRDMDAFGQYIYYNVLGPNLYSRTIREIYPGIFSWLNLQNVNERLILGLMIIVSIINMITALMILILERTKMIGILKALGSDNWTIRKVFLYHATFIIGLGLFLGNLFGIGFCLLQQHYGFITLPEEAYYVSVAPVDLDYFKVLLLNVLALVVTVGALIVPTALVSYVDPVRAIRFK